MLLGLRDLALDGVQTRRYTAEQFGRPVRRMQADTGEAWDVLELRHDAVVLLTPDTITELRGDGGDDLVCPPGDSRDAVLLIGEYLRQRPGVLESPVTILDGVADVVHQAVVPVVYTANRVLRTLEDPLNCEPRLLH